MLRSLPYFIFSARDYNERVRLSLAGPGALPGENLSQPNKAFVRVLCSKACQCSFH